MVGLLEDLQTRLRLRNVDSLLELARCHELGLQNPPQYSKAEAVYFEGEDRAREFCPHQLRLAWDLTHWKAVLRLIAMVERARHGPRYWEEVRCLDPSLGETFLRMNPRRRTQRLIADRERELRALRHQEVDEGRHHCGGGRGRTL